jgi:hypothetical protein
MQKIRMLDQGSLVAHPDLSMHVGNLFVCWGLLQVARAVRIIKFLKLLKLLRVARMMRLPFTIGRLERKIGTQTVKMITMALGMLLMLHWTACIWYYVAAMYRGQDTWIAIQNLEDADHAQQYITALWVPATADVLSAVNSNPITADSSHHSRCRLPQRHIAETPGAGLCCRRLLLQLAAGHTLMSHCTWLIMRMRCQTATLPGVMPCAP